MKSTENKPKMRVVEEHECKATEGDNNQIGIQLYVKDIDGKVIPQGWFWVDWSVKKPLAEQIFYCPYCGEKLEY